MEGIKTSPNVRDRDLATGVSMAVQNAPSKYPLLDELLAFRQTAIQATFTIREVANLFGVTPRAIQTRVASGQLASRDLPGRAKFLPVDLENFLQNSRRNNGK
jgi:hypothetical protein